MSIVVICKRKLIRLIKCNENVQNLSVCLDNGPDDRPDDGSQSQSERVESRRSVVLPSTTRTDRPSSGPSACRSV